ncbi:cytochrome P450 [Actinocorallia lasiicapitis]
MPSGDRVPMLVRYDDVRAALVSPAASRNLRAPGLPRMVSGMSVDDDPTALINQDGADHTRFRRILQGAFTPRAVAKWRPRTAEIADELIDGLDSSFDLVSEFAVPLPARVICAVLGVPADRFEEFRGWTEMFMSTTNASAEARGEGYAAFMGYAAELVAAHRAEPGDDLIDAMIQARDADDRLSEGELVNMVFTLILAGHETTAAMISRGIFRLLLHPEQFAAVRDDPGLIAPAVEEIMRSEGPGNGLFRLAATDMALPSGTVPAGTVLLPNEYAANHDPAAYDAPDRFDIRRFTDPDQPPHLGFGHGPHYCLGANLARLELQESIRAVVTRLPDLRLTVDPATLEWTQDALMYRPVRLPVTA